MLLLFHLGDSGHDLGYKCSNCVSSGNACTHEELAKVGYPPSLSKEIYLFYSLSARNLCT